MALKEGRCVNCGSFLFLDPDTPKGHCLFCDCVFDTEDAFKANENPELFTFPNEEQPKYEGPSLSPGRNRRGPVVTAPPVPVTPVETKEESYELPQSKVPDLKIPMKSIILYSALTLIVLGILAAVAFPLIAKRNHRQAEILDRFADRLGYQVDKGRDIRIQEMTGTEVVVVLPEKITAEEGLDLFNLYCEIRAEVIELQDTSFKKVKSPVTLRIATPDGGYLIDQPADEAQLTPQTLLELD